jgi:endonuclease-3
MLGSSNYSTKSNFIVILILFSRTIGIGVDIHVHRITNRLNWVRTNTPEQTREVIQAFLIKH